MNPKLQHDLDNFEAILRDTVAEAVSFLAGLNERPAGLLPAEVTSVNLPETGIGASQALAVFKDRFGAGITGSAGPRYFGFVTGGATPASVMGDWLTSVFDQNAVDFDSSATYIEMEALHFLRQLFGLPPDFSGTFVTGATVSNFVSLAIARQWAAGRHGLDVALDGLYAVPPIKILSGTPHASIYKALSMLGLGRNALETIATQPDREAVDLEALRQRLVALDGEPCIVVGNAGTVNTVDFDDFEQLAALKDEFNVWLHIDGAFGGFAGASPTYRHLLAGVEQADSITIDAHKWLNVPYDAATQFTRHQDLQLDVFQNSAAYLGDVSDPPEFFHLTPENSRRFRALPAWFTLMAYGREGHREIVERNCAMAAALGDLIAASEKFRLLAPTRMNVVCFTLNQTPLSRAVINQFLARLRDDGRIFLTPTTYKGTPAIRAAISNWRTGVKDIDIAWEALSSVSLQTPQTPGETG